MKKVELYKTSNGEYTLYLPDMDETYHSRHGAISESLHVFIDQGLSRFEDYDKLDILEIGFGTGLNALLTALHPHQTQVRNYCSLEPYPVEPQTIIKLGYVERLQQQEAAKVFDDILDAEWNTTVAILDHFYLTKIDQKFENWNPAQQSFDLVYFDAFAPKKQEELWDKGIFQKLYALLKPKGVLTTYSAAGQLKRDLKSAGFTIENPPGANGKRQMTVAIKS